MHLVGARLEPGKKTPRAVPDFLAPRAFTLDHPLARLGRQFAPRRIKGHTPQPGELLQVLLALEVGLGLPGLDRPGAQRPGLIGNDQSVVNADGAAKTAAGLTRAQGRIERERARCRGLVGEVTLRTVQLA